MLTYTRSLWKSMTLAISYSARRLRKQKATDVLLVSASWAERHTESAWRGPGRSNVPAIQYNPIQQACMVRLTKKLRVYCYKGALVASPFALNKLHYLGCQSGRKIIHPGLSSQTHSIHFGFFLLLFNVSLLSFSGLCEMRILTQPHFAFLKLSNNIFMHKNESI